MKRGRSRAEMINLGVPKPVTNGYSVSDLAGNKHSISVHRQSGVEA
jgi:hypothetical protein